MKIKTRFCPSPTGVMHLGNARTALFSALFAKAHEGIFLLRIEDTDRERSKPEYTEQLCHDLRQLGLYWQEGPYVGGKHAPYYQSERQAIYDHYYAKLEEQGLAYLCFCSEEELAWQRKTQLASGHPPRYPGTCRKLSKTEITAKLTQGLQPTLRFKVPEHGNITFQDAVKGEHSFAYSDIGDFIIRRTDGTSPFLFCNAIDDALMGVTHVLRGEDHLTNTPRQIMILQALGLPIPTYAHIPLIVGGDGSPLSKRHGSRSIKELLATGYLAKALYNYLARLGHYYETHELLELEELAKQFRLERIGRAPAHFDSQQLWHWQKLAIMAADTEQLWNWLDAETKQLIPQEKKIYFLEWVKPNIVFPLDTAKWAHICFTQDITYEPAAKAVLQYTEPAFFQAAITGMQEEGADYHRLVDYLKKRFNLSGKKLFQPLRCALTGEGSGPELAPLWQIMPEELLYQRFRQAIHLAQLGK